MKVNFRKTGILLIATSLVLSIIYLIFHQQILRFFERYFSADQIITPHGERELVSAFYFGMFLLLAVGIGVFKSSDSIWRASVKRIFLEDPASSASSRPSPRFTLILSPLLGLILIISMRLSNKIPAMHVLLYKKDHGFIDLLVSALILISTVFMSLAAWKVIRMRLAVKISLLLSGFYIFMAVLLLLYAGEEISWGQDFIHWNTPEVFAGNLEDQTNLHNYLNTYFDFGYLALSLVLAILMASATMELRQAWLPYNRFIFPHPSLIGLSLIIAFVAIVWYQEQELLEEMMAVFVLFYSLRIFNCFRSRNLLFEAELN